MNLDGRSVLLTGATGGLGQTLARRLRAKGADLVLTGRRQEELEALAAETDGRALVVDLSADGAAERLAREAGAIDVLVANAGIPASGPLSSFDLDEIDRAIAVNLHAPMVLARLLSDGMVARGAGHVVFVSSAAGRVGSGGGSVYSATKFGLRGFAQGLREDLRPLGVGVSVIMPGFVRDAGMYADSGASLPPYVGTSSPDDVADAVIRGIERNRGEIDVAPITMKAGTLIASMVPELAATVSRWLGGQRIARDLADGQRDKR